MVVAVWLLGVGTLKDLALIQLVGIIVGTYSSIFFATPLLVTLRERTELVQNPQPPGPRGAAVRTRIGVSLKWQERRFDGGRRAGSRRTRRVLCAGHDPGVGFVGHG